MAAKIENDFIMKLNAFAELAIRGSKTNEISLDNSPLAIHQ